MPRLGIRDSRLGTARAILFPLASRAGSHGTLFVPWALRVRIKGPGLYWAGVARQTPAVFFFTVNLRRRIPIFGPEEFEVLIRPIKGLVDSPEKWDWSSYNNFSLDPKLVEQCPIQIDYSDL